MCTYRTLLGKLLSKDHLGKSDIDTNTILIPVPRNGVFDWRRPNLYDTGQISAVKSFCRDDTKLSGSIEAGNFLET